MNAYDEEEFPIFGLVPWQLVMWNWLSTVFTVQHLILITCCGTQHASFKLNTFVLNNKMQHPASLHHDATNLRHDRANGSMAQELSKLAAHPWQFANNVQHTGRLS
eukprot:1136616-Pelagomonas_calceolata.AAC.2